MRSCPVEWPTILSRKITVVTGGRKRHIRSLEVPTSPSAKLIENVPRYSLEVALTDSMSKNQSRTLLRNSIAVEASFAEFIQVKIAASCSVRQELGSSTRV